MFRKTNAKWYSLNYTGLSMDLDLSNFPRVHSGAMYVGVPEMTSESFSEPKSACDRPKSVRTAFVIFTDVFNQDIFGLDVSMDDSSCMCVCKCFQKLFDQGRASAHDREPHSDNHVRPRTNSMTRYGFPLQNILLMKGSIHLHRWSRDQEP